MIARALSALAVAAVVAACSDDTIVLAHIPGATDDGGGSSSPPVRCANNTDCNAGSFCSMSSCDDDVGTCAPIPVDCPADHAPVCGCDRVMYFNDCLRQASRVPANSGAQCDLGAPMPCGNSSPCPDGAYCARIYDPPPGAPPDCPSDVPGVCWVIPAQCPSTPQGPNRFDVCGAGAPQCVDSCNAIRSGLPFHRAHLSDCPPP